MQSVVKRGYLVQTLALTGLTRCTWCRQEGAISLCGRCKISGYCSKEHQRADWPMHKLMCDAQMQKMGEALAPVPRAEWGAAAKRLNDTESVVLSRSTDGAIREEKAGDVTVTARVKTANLEENRNAAKPDPEASALASRVATMVRTQAEQQDLATGSEPTTTEP